MEQEARDRHGTGIRWGVVLPGGTAIWIVALLLVVGSGSLAADPADQVVAWLRAAVCIAGVLATVCLVVLARSRPGVSDVPDAARMGALHTRLADRTRLLHEAYQDIQTLERAKETFLSNMSHEMRTPLTSIMAAEEILSSYADEDPGAREEFLNIIHVESQRLLGLIGKLLDLVKLEAKSLHLHYENVDLCALVEETACSIQSQLSGRANSVVVTKPAHPILCECDRERVARVVHSMMENALRFSPEDGTISVDVTSKDDSVRVAVTDAGDRVDERFTDLFEGECVGRDGTGGSPFLGYPIGKRLAAMHGGSLLPDHAESGGTRITLTLPLRQSQMSEASRDQEGSRATV